MKKLAKQAAKQIAQEPLEVLKTVKKQVVQTEKTQRTEATVPVASEKIGEKGPYDEEKIKTQNKRLLEALEAEIEDIRKQKEQEEEEKLRQEELEAKVEEEKKEKPLVEVVAKPSRKFMGGMKRKLSKLKRKAEIRMPPSG
jgi:methyl coenzyme M reductase subunit C-like uncharacterized protein (methanogenesis marker protein 7)